MTIYNINKGIGWASSGVEYAQAYRANIFKKNGQKCKFIFTDMFYENIEPMTKNLGFEDSDIIWLYQFFTDIQTSPTTFLLSQLLNEFSGTIKNIEENESFITYYFDDNSTVIRAFLDKTSMGRSVYKSEIIFQNKLVQRDYYTCVKIFTEYFKPVNEEIKLYQRRFFNKDGSVAYDEILNGNQSLFIFPDRTIYSFENLITHFIDCLGLTSKDILLLDRSTGIGPAVIKSKSEAKIGVIIHAEHFSSNVTTDKNILWNNFYEYQFKNAKFFDFFVCPTDIQKKLIEEQFKKYKKGPITVYTIPVGSIDECKLGSERVAKSLITASRLAEEKHLDWLIEAVIDAKKVIHELTFDIYGEGGERRKLEQLILKRDAQGFIKLKGQHKLQTIYKNYETYVSASTSEGFGLTLLEAVSSGLAMVGFDVMYGNPTFIKNEKNGYLVKYSKNEKEQNIKSLSNAIINLYMLDEKSRENFEKTSYEISQPFLTRNVQEMWKKLEQEITHD